MGTLLHGWLPGESLQAPVARGGGDVRQEWRPAPTGAASTGKAGCSPSPGEKCNGTRLGPDGQVFSNVFSG